MAHKHPKPQLLQKFLGGEATKAELQDLVWHLLEACPDCAVALGVEDRTEVFSESGGDIAIADSAEAGLDEMVDRVRRRVRPLLDLVSNARSEASGLLAELQGHPVERQRLLVQNAGRFQSLPLADLLLETAWKRGFHEPADADSLIGLALELLDRVGPEAFGEGVLNDLRGRAWAYRGNLLRIRSALRDSEEAFRRAGEFLAVGSGDPLEVARLLGLKSTLLRFQQRFDAAAVLVRECLQIYRDLGESHLEGRTLVTQALLLHETGDPAQALGVLMRAQELIEPERDPYLVRVIQQNSVTYLMELGRHEEALALLPALRRHIIDAGQPIELLRLRWQEGRVLLGLGHEARAEAAYLEVRKGFVEQGIAHDAAMVSLELAGLYLRQGRTAEIRELTRQMVPLFQSRDLHQGAIAALMLFQRAVEMDTLTLRMVEEVAEKVRQAQGTPRSKHQDH